ncbi:hypothetical protein VKT23_018702 [Stygiomarasmius scandens]|uniref:MFS general substrate transporter n=1 Tax=Marasmiellus scandens TaxID=2682957 RepID=A0ABR1IQ27_9AGAR
MGKSTTPLFQLKATDGHKFTKRRGTFGLATGISVSGYGVGGLVLSPVTQKLIDTLGFRWALRTTGLMTLVVLGVADYFMKSRPGANTGSKKTKVNLKLMKDPVFAFLCGIGLSSAFGFYVPIFYVPDYARNALGRSAKDGATSAALISALSAVGRVLLGFFGDRFGHITALIMCQGLGGISQMAIWPFTRDLSGLMGFSSFYGFFSGGFVSLYPVVAAEIYGVEGLASIAGAMFSSYIPGTLVGPPIAGAIIDNNTAPDGKINFLSTQLYGGSWLIGSCFMASMAMYYHRIHLKSARIRHETEEKDSGVVAREQVNDDQLVV